MWIMQSEMSWLAYGAVSMGRRPLVVRIKRLWRVWLCSKPEENTQWLRRACLSPCYLTGKRFAAVPERWSTWLAGPGSLSFG
jgi:hypothetical protein